MQIYILRDNQQTGPFTEAEVRAQVAAGTLAPDTMVWWDGLPEWKEVSQTPLASAPVASASSPSSAFTPPPFVPGNAMGTRTSGLAIGALISGVLGLLCWPILGPAAVIMGHISRAQIRKNPSALTGGGIALAGIILGYFEIALFIGYLVLIAIAGPKLQQQILKMQQQIQQQAQDQQMQQQQNQNTNNPAATLPPAPANPPATPSPGAPDTAPTPPANPPATPDNTPPPPPPANPPATPSNT